MSGPNWARPKTVAARFAEMDAAVAALERRKPRSKRVEGETLPETPGRGETQPSDAQLSEAGLYGRLGLAGFDEMVGR